MEFSPIGVLGQRGNQFFRLTEVGQCFLRGRAQQCLLGGGDEVAYRFGCMGSAHVVVRQQFRLHLNRVRKSLLVGAGDACV